MKTYLFFILIFGLPSIALATSYAPEKAPSVSVEDALSSARKFAEKNLDNSIAYYVDRVWIGRIPGSKERTWIVSFANPKLGYYFVTISMKGEIGTPAKEVYTENPFLIYELKPNQNDNHNP